MSIRFHSPGQVRPSFQFPPPCMAWWWACSKAVISGARGIIYFPHKLGGTEGSCTTPTPDGTTAPIQTEMTRVNAALAALPAT
jgi:hypothetical protein